MLFIRLMQKPFTKSAAWMRTRKPELAPQMDAQTDCPVSLEIRLFFGVQLVGRSQSHPSFFCAAREI
jgi:hypothetical protein